MRLLHVLGERAPSRLLQFHRVDPLLADGGDAVGITALEEIAHNVSHAPEAEGADQEDEEHLGGPGAGEAAE